MEVYACLCLLVVMRREAHETVAAVKCLMHEQHLSEKVGISCICTTHGPCCPFALVFFKFPAFSVCDGWMLVWFGGADGGYREVFIKENTKESFRRGHGAQPFSKIKFFNICDLRLFGQASYCYEMIHFDFDFPNILQARNLQLVSFMTPAVWTDFCFPT